jgi:hypothetical protein
MCSPFQKDQHFGTLQNHESSLVKKIAHMPSSFVPSTGNTLSRGIIIQHATNVYLTFSRAFTIISIIADPVALRN